MALMALKVEEEAANSMLVVWGGWSVAVKTVVMTHRQQAPELWCNKSITD